MRAYAHGDPAALETLVERYSISAVRFAAHFTRGGQAARAGLVAEDIAQDVFVKLVSALRSGAFDPSRGRFAPFFFRMIRNHAIDRLRQRTGAVSLDVEPAGDWSDSGAAHAEREEERALVRDFILKLPHSERAAITLREFDGLSYKEIAEALDAPVDSVKTWIFRARRKIEDAWLAMEANRGSV